MIIALQRFCDRLYNAIVYPSYVQKYAIGLSRRNRFVLVTLSVFTLLCGVESTVVLASPCFQEPPPTTTASQGNPLTGQGTEEPKGYTVPIRFDPPQLAFILVEGYLLKEDAPNEVVDKKPLLFVVDTGMPAAFLLTEWAAKEMGFKTVASPLKNGFQQLEPVKLMCLNREKDSGFVLPSKDGAYQAKSVSIVDLFSRQPIAGIIGMQTLMLNTSRFDLDKKTWTFYPGAAALRNTISEKALTLPYRFEPKRGVLPMVELVVGKKENDEKKKSGEAGQKRVTVIFDTGSMNTTIDKEQIKGLSLETRSPIRREMRRAHGTFPVTTTLIPSMSS
jgi:hypothetical protein